MLEDGLLFITALMPLVFFGLTIYLISINKWILAALSATLIFLSLSTLALQLVSYLAI